jgi:hypothetical protein
MTYSTSETQLVFAASDIVERIEKGEWTAAEVLEAYIARAAFSTNLTNCITEGEQHSGSSGAR